MSQAFNNLSVTFDLDGTLVDTAPDLIRVLNEVTRADGLAPVPVADARDLIGFGSMALIKNAYEGENRELNESHAKTLQKQFLEIYADTIAQNSPPFPGVPEVLAELKRAGACLSVCTNKPGAMARSLMQQLGLSPFFDRIVGGDDVLNNKPAAQHIFTAVGHRGKTPIVMVGDGAPDAYAAKAAKASLIMMIYGYCPISVHTFGADAVLRNFRELPPALKSILAV